MAINRVARKTATWANSAAAGTTVDVDVDISDFPQSLIGKYLVIVYNPSLVTQLTGTIQTRFSDDAGVARVATKRVSGADETLVTPLNTTKSSVVEGFHAARGLRLSLKNDTVLGVADGFTAKVEVYAL